MSRLHILEFFFFSALLFFLPTQLGYHVWPWYTTVLGFRVDYLSPTLFVTDLLVITLFVLFLARRLRTLHFSMKVVGLCGIFFILQLTTSTYPFITLYSIWKVLEMGFVSYYVAHSWAEIPKKYILVPITGGVLLESLLALSQFLHQGSLGGMLYWLGERTFTIQSPGIATAALNGALMLRPYGTLPHPNVLAGYMLIFCLLIVSFRQKLTPQRYLWRVILLLLGTCTILLTLSRSVLVVTVTISLGTLLWAGKHQKAGRLFFYLCIVALACISFGLSPLPSRFAHIVTEQSFIERKELFAYAWKIFLSHPLTGVGLGTFIPGLAHIASPLHTLFFLQPVHNMYLLILAETGIVGALLCGAFLIATAKRVYKKANTSLWCVVALSSILCLGVVDHYFITLQQGQLLFALVIGICWQKTSKRAPK